jgi:hypothetical protein
MLRYCPAHDVHEGIIVLNIKKSKYNEGAKRKQDNFRRLHTRTYIFLKINLKFMDFILSSN